MVWAYPGRYRDQAGEEAITIENDGKKLRTVVRGVAFWGSTFDSLEPSENQDPAKLASFELTCLGKELSACTIEWEMPLTVVVDQKIEDGTLYARLELGRPLPNNARECENLQLELVVNEDRWQSSKGGGDFEIGLLAIQEQLPPGVYVKACINCAFSDYCPGGNDTFGTLACFRGDKQGYRSVHSKADMFVLWKKLTEYVQETYLCPEFERRLPGTGYRG